jgi:hypothetical protein
MTSPSPHTIDAVRAAVPAVDTATTAPAPGGGQLGAVLDVLTGVSPVLVTVYLVARLLIPALLIATLTRKPSATQRIALLRDYPGAGTHHDPRDDR